MRQIWWQALRRLGKRPGITLVLVLTFALGSGLNTAMFSVAEVLLLRPLPYAQPDRLLAIWPSRVFSPEQLLFLRDRCREFTPAAVSSGWDLSLTSIAQPEQVSGAKVTGNFFSLLGVKPLLGRTLTPAEDRPGSPPVAVLSYQLWQRRFGSDPRVVNQAIALGGASFTVVGVMPAGFRYLQDTSDVWIPLSLDPGDSSFKSEHALVIARLRPGSTLGRAQGEVQQILKSMQQELHSPQELDKESPAVPLQESVIRDIQPKLLLLLAGVNIVLLIACANVASLLLSVALSRQRETSLRAALGANRSQLMRPILVESLLVTLMGSAVGLLFAYWGLQVLVARLPASTPRLGEIGVDGVVLAYTTLLALAGGLLTGLVAAVTGTRQDLSRMLGEASHRASEGKAPRRLRQQLTVLEIALAVVLVTCAGLVAKSFWRLTSVNPGFRTDHVLAFNLIPSPGRYAQPEQRRDLYRQILERLRSLPGVESVGAIQHLPLSGFFWSTSVQVADRPAAPGEPQPRADWRLITPDYLKTMGIPLLSGRAFTDTDRKGAPDVVLINETMMKRLWPNSDAVGRRINAGRATGKSWATIVGVVGDVRHDGLSSEVKSEIYRPFDQQPLLNMTVVAHTAGDPRRLGTTIRSLLGGIDRELPVSKVQTLEDLVNHSISQQRLITSLFQLFAAIALALGTIGIYGLMSYDVSRRVHEIGVRMVLGATRSEVLQLFLRDGAAIVAVGLVLGLLASFWATHLLESLLFGVSARDGWIFGVVTLLMVATGLAASYLPAAGATRIPPRQALGGE